MEVNYVTHLVFDVYGVCVILLRGGSIIGGTSAP
jgi:hypothetical protein